MQATQAAESARKPIFIGMGVQLLIAFTLVFALVFGGSFYWFYNFATDVAMSRLEEDLETLLVGASSQIDGDAFAELIALGGDPTKEGYYPEEGSPAFEAYLAHIALLRRLHEIDTRGNFYTYYHGAGANEVVYVGDSLAATEAGRESAAPFMQSADYGPIDGPVILAGTERLNLYTEIYSDENFPGGQYISGYYPIFNSEGIPVGAVGVDFQATYVRRVQQDVENAFLPVLGITAVLVLIMALGVSQLLTRRIKALTRAAERIGEGNYDQDLTGLTPGRFADEIGTLAHVFQIMVSKVATRERKLKQQVAEMQIMIDETRRKEQVEEIVDSDFFRDLQIKARKLRQEFAQAGSAVSPETQTTTEPTD